MGLVGPPRLPGIHHHCRIQADLTTGLGGYPIGNQIGEGLWPGAVSPRKFPEDLRGPAGVIHGYCEIDGSEVLVAIGKRHVVRSLSFTPPER